MPSLKILFCVLFSLLLLLHIHKGPTLTPSLSWTKTSASSHRFCFVYDRPPRTGSSTVSASLRSCLTRTGFQEQERQSLSWANRTSLVSKALALPHDRIALVSTHVHFTFQDVDNLRQDCQNLFYVSGASPMRSRVWSAVKHSLVGRDFEGEITGDLLEMAKERLISKRAVERYLEQYPYELSETDGEMGQDWWVRPEQRIVPDYVITKGNLEQQLSALLERLGCEPSAVKTRNLHRVQGESKPPPVALSEGDRVYRWLTYVARERNSDGLKKLDEFMAKLNEETE